MTCPEVCDGETFLDICFGVANVLDIDLSTEFSSDSTGGVDGVSAFSTFAVDLDMLGPLLMIGLMTLVPLLVLRAIPESALEDGVAGIWS